jgi:cytochrome d ubiquinol oxidase subunit II
VLGSADFGAGFWDLTAGGAHRGGRIRGLVQRSMAPVWEANHVWLIFVSSSPGPRSRPSFASLFSTLSIPLFLARSGSSSAAPRSPCAARRARSRGAPARRPVRPLVRAHPVLPRRRLGGIASGRVPVGNATGDAVTSWLNPTSVLVGVLGIVAGAYLAACSSRPTPSAPGSPTRPGVPGAALGSGVVTGLIAIGGLLVVRADARPLFDGLTSGGGLVMVLASGVAGAVTLALVWAERYGLARLTSAAAVTAVVVGWVLAQDPYVLPPSLTLEEAAASDATLGAVVFAVGVGAVVLIPSLWLLYRLVLRGRLDQGFEPLDQRYRPLSASDEAGSRP